ncbi:MAG: hypothetical protein HUJ30_08365 [Gammaproteobacteria bacterium]|nr:hypothetical protein [Gammaproteobacteria bacterium]
MQRIITTVLLTLGFTLPALADVPKALVFPQPSAEVAHLCQSITALLASTGKELEEKLGKADKVEKVPMTNRHDPKAKDSRNMYRYSDGMVSIYTVPKMNASYLEAAIFTQNFWPDSIPSYIGKTAAQIKQLLGKPDEVDNERIAYYCSYETNDSINFLLKEQRVYRMVLRNIIE